MNELRTLRNDNLNHFHKQAINTLTKTSNLRKKSIRDMDGEFYAAITTPEVAKKIRRVIDAHQDRRISDLSLYAKEMASAIMREIEEGILLRHNG